MIGTRSAWGLVRSCHLGPTVAVTLLVAGYAVSVGLDPARIGLVSAAVFTGQLSIGWSNDLIDLRRDRAVGRGDKPLATGDVGETAARIACGLALVLTVVLSLACGVVAGLVQLVTVAAGWAYNLGVKGTALSWVPYALAFGALPVFVVLADPGAGAPRWGISLAAALCGVGAHLLNVLPDLSDDEATGVRGLAHRIGYRQASLVAVASLAAAAVVIALGAVALPAVVWAPALGLVAVLSVVAVVARGRTPFRAAIGIAMVGVLLVMMAG